MTDPDLIAKKLAVIETHVRELRTLVDIEKIRVDVKEERSEPRYSDRCFAQRALGLARICRSDSRAHR
jgi:hypothetical protein